MTYNDWLSQVIEILGLDDVDPQSLDEEFSQLRPLLYEGGASPSEAADLVRGSLENIDVL